MRLSSACAALLALPALAAAQQEALPSTSTYTLLHRVVGPGAADTAWSPRARVHVKHEKKSSAASRQASKLSEGYVHAHAGSTAKADAPAASAHRVENLVSQAQWNAIAEGGPFSWYQVALVEGEASAQPDAAPIAAAKLCQVRPAGTHTLTLHLSAASPALFSAPGAPALRPHAVEYSAPHAALGADGCPAAAHGSYSVEGHDALDVQVKVAQPAAVPPLRRPAPVREDGTPAPPVEQPSFLRKYWYFIIPVLILLLLPAEADSGGSAEHDPSSSNPPHKGLAAKRVK